MNKIIKKVVITGPESTGKSQLCEQLSYYYKTIYVDEFARNFLINSNNIYNKEDLIFFANKQIENESKLIDEANNYLFIDTDIINIKIWMQEVFNENSKELNVLIKNNPYDLYLLADIDIPWEADLLRANEHNRAELYNRFEEELNLYNLPYKKLSGIGNDRLKNAIEIIDSFFK
jgi:NadR type nicotinamide-nucleotide adenylyltransferase